MSFSDELAKDPNQPIYILELEGQKGSEALHSFDSRDGVWQYGDASGLTVDTSRAKEGAASIQYDKAAGSNTVSGLDVEFVSDLTLREDFETAADWTAEAATQDIEAYGSALHGTQALRFDRRLRGDRLVKLDAWPTTHRGEQAVGFGLSANETTETSEQREGSGCLEIDKGWQYDLIEGFEAAGEWSIRAGTGSVDQETSNVTDGSGALSLTKTGTSGTQLQAEKTTTRNLANMSLFSMDVYLPSADASKIASVDVTFAEDSGYTTYSTYQQTGGLVAGWNRITFWMDRPTSTGGGPARTAIIRIAVRVTTNSATDTFSGVLFDNLRYVTVTEGEPIEELDDASEWYGFVDTSGVAQETSNTKSGGKAVTFDKTGTTQTWGGGIGKNYSTALRFHEDEVHGFWIYLPTGVRTNLNFVAIRYITSTGNYRTWTAWNSGDLADGWNNLRFHLSGGADTGSPSMGDVTTIQVYLNMNSASDTFSGVIVDHIYKVGYALETFNSTSGWAYWTGSGAVALDHTNYMESDSALRLTKTNTGASEAGVVKTVWSNGISLDQVRRCRIAVYVPGNELEYLSKFRLYLDESTSWSAYSYYDWDQAELSSGWNILEFDPALATGTSGAPDLRNIQRLGLQIVTRLTTDTLTTGISVDLLTAAVDSAFTAGFSMARVNDNGSWFTPSDYSRLRFAVYVPAPTGGSVTEVVLRLSETWDHSTYSEYVFSGVATDQWNYLLVDPTAPDREQGQPTHGTVQCIRAWVEISACGGQMTDMYFDELAGVNADSGVAAGVYKTGLSLDLSGDELGTVGCYIPTADDVEAVTLTLDETDSKGTQYESFEATTDWLPAGRCISTTIATDGTTKVRGTYSLEIDRRAAPDMGTREWLTAANKWRRYNADTGNPTADTTHVLAGDRSIVVNKTGTSGTQALIERIWGDQTQDFRDCMVEVAAWIDPAYVSQMSALHVWLGSSGSLLNSNWARWDSKDRLCPGWNAIRFFVPADGGATAVMDHYSGTPDFSAVDTVGVGFTCGSAAFTPQVSFDRLRILDATKAADVIDDCDSGTWTAIADAGSIAFSSSTRWGNSGSSISWNKPNGTSAYSGVRKVVSGALDNLFTASDEMEAWFYISSTDLANIDYVRLRFYQNDYTNYTDWRFAAGNLNAGWNRLRCRIVDWTAGYGSADMSDIYAIGCYVECSSAGTTLGTMYLDAWTLSPEISMESCETTTGWSTGAGAANLAVSGTAKEGTYGLSYDKTGTSQTHAGIYTSTSLTQLRGMDLDAIARIRVSCYIPSAHLSKVAAIRVLIGDNSGGGWGNYYIYEKTSGLVAGWNHFEFNPRDPTGSWNSPNEYCDKLWLGIRCNNATDTFTGVIFDDITILLDGAEQTGLIKTRTSSFSLAAQDRLRMCFYVKDLAHLAQIEQLVVRASDRYDDRAYYEWHLPHSRLAVGWNYMDFDPAAPDVVVGNPTTTAMTRLFVAYENYANEIDSDWTDAYLDNFTSVIAAVYRETAPRQFGGLTWAFASARWHWCDFVLASPDTTYAHGSTAPDRTAIERLVFAVEFSDALDELNNIRLDYFHTKTLDKKDVSSYNALGWSHYLEDATNVSNFRLTLVDSTGTWASWDHVSEPASGWNDVQIGIARDPDGSGGGTLDKTDIRWALVVAVFDNATDTLADMNVDWLVGWTGYCQFSTHDVKGADSGLLLPGVLAVPGTLTQRAAPEDGRTTISGMTTSLLNDADGHVLEALSANEWRGRSCLLRMGFPALDYTEYRTLDRYRVNRISYDGARFLLTCDNDLAQMKEPVMTSATSSSPVTLAGNIITLWLKMLTSTGNGTNGDYDVLPADQGIGFPVDRLNIAEIEQERDDWLSAWTVEFVFTDRERDFKAWADREVFKACGAILRVKDGLVTIKARRAPLAADSLATVDREHIDKRIIRWQSDMRDIINQVVFRYDYDEGDDEFDSTATYDDDAEVLNDKTSQDLFGVHSWELKSKGIKTAQSTAMFAGRAAGLFQRYSFGPPELPVRTDLSYLDVGLGDVVTFTDSELPDLEDGTMGLTSELLEVHELSVDHARGEIRMKLINSGWRRGRYAVVSPASVTIDYDGATDEQKGQYAWIADNNNFLGTDDDDAYEITPG